MQTITSAGAPEFVVEIANSSASNDLHQKLEVYRRNGVREYLVWRTMEGEFDYMVLKDGQFRQPPRDPMALSAVRFFPVCGEHCCCVAGRFGRRRLQTMQHGIASAEHVAFLEHLSRRPHQTSLKASGKCLRKSTRVSIVTPSLNQGTYIESPFGSGADAGLFQPGKSWWMDSASATTRWTFFPLCGVASGSASNMFRTDRGQAHASIKASLKPPGRSSAG